MKKLYSVKDTVTGLWTDPAVMNNDAEATRAFITMEADKNTMIGAHPEDFELYRIGDWNKEHGSIENVCEYFLARGIKQMEE